MASWLVKRNGSGRREIISPVDLHDSRDPLAAPHILRRDERSAWAYLRVARFKSRPGHADQLHLDLWWRGTNLALDAGSYLYNHPIPWDNALASSDVHNTLTIDDRDQMTHAGRFLWLDWAQGRAIAREKAPDGSYERLVAEHDGYRRLGLTHRRSVTAWEGGRWVVEDIVFSKEGHLRGTAEFEPQFVRLHWLLPNWPWEIESLDGGHGAELRLESPHGPVHLKIRIEQAGPVRGSHTLSRAGERLSGEGFVAPTWGWFSPTYGVKEPALSFAFQVNARPPVTLSSEWVLP
jgi:hypothetical protein